LLSKITINNYKPVLPIPPELPVIVELPVFPTFPTFPTFPVVVFPTPDLTEVLEVPDHPVLLAKTDFKLLISF